MKAVVQRVTDASVTVNGELKGSIGNGLLVYLGVARDDSPADADWLAEKIAHLRIFDDAEGKMNLSLLDIVNHIPRPHTEFTEKRSTRRFLKILNFPRALRVLRASVRVSFSSTPPVGVLAVSQFTLLGDARKGRRPSWEKAAPPEKARELYVYFMEQIRTQGLVCESGEFQARMRVSYTNDGPVTILLDSTER